MARAFGCVLFGFAAASHALTRPGGCARTHGGRQALRTSHSTRVTARQCALLAQGSSVHTAGQSARLVLLVPGKPSGCSRTHTTTRISKVHASAKISNVKSELSTRPTDPRDIEVIRRQLGYAVPEHCVLGAGASCRHGYLQAFAWNPVQLEGPDSKLARIHSSLFRLSCPLLVKAIDEWEAQGAVKSINEEARGDESGKLAADLNTAHLQHIVARKEVIGDNLEVAMANASATQAQVMETIMASGIAGQTLEKTDIKCLHAQVADTLCRSRSNKIGELILERLAARGVDVDGNDGCCEQCNPAVAAEQAKFWYVPKKNKSKLRVKRARRMDGMKKAGLRPADKFYFYEKDEVTRRVLD